MEPPKSRKSVGAECNWGIRFQTDADALAFMDNLAGELSTRMKGVPPQVVGHQAGAGGGEDDAGAEHFFVVCMHHNTAHTADCAAAQSLSSVQQHSGPVRGLKGSQCNMPVTARQCGLSERHNK